MVTAVSGGVATITYALPTSCISTADFTVNALPAAISGPSQVCATEGITLTDATAGGTWSSSDITIATIGGTSGVVSGLMAGTVDITYTLPTTCMITTNLTVNALPIVHNVTGGGSYCFSGTGVNIGMDNSEVGNTYKLYHGASLMATQPGTAGTVNFGSLVTAGVYTAVATSSAGCNSDMAGSATVVVIPLVTPGITIGAAPNDTVCAGTSSTFTATPVNGGTTPTYVWRVNGTIVGSTSTTHTYTPVDGDVVSVVMTSNETCPSPATAAASQAMVVVSNETPTVSITAHSGLTTLATGDSVCQGTVVAYSASSTFGGTSPVYTWYKNGTSTGSTGTTHTYVPIIGDVITAKLNSNYRCPITNNVSSNVMAIHVDSVYVPIALFTVIPGVDIDPGTAVTIVATVTSAGPAPLFQWIKNTTPISGATSATFTSTTLANGDSISCRVVGTGGCSFYTFNCVKMRVTNGVARAFANEADITLSPNPNNGAFTLNGTLATANDAEVTLEITDMVGHVVYESKVAAHGGKLNAHVQTDNSLASGMYMLSVRSGNESKMFRFVIKQ